MRWSGMGSVVIDMEETPKGLMSEMDATAGPI